MKRRFAGVMLMVVCALMFGHPMSERASGQQRARPVSRTIPPIDPAKNYRVVSAFSIFALAINGDSSNPGQPLVNEPYRNEPWRKWRFVALPLDGGQQYYQFFSVRSGLVMASIDPSVDDPEPIVTQALWNNTDAQKWMIEDAADGRVRIKRKGSNKFLFVRENDVQVRQGDAAVNPQSLFDAWILVEEPVTTLKVTKR